jgi:hypothetical protein
MSQLNRGFSPRLMLFMCCAVAGLFRGFAQQSQQSAKAGFVAGLARIEISGVLDGLLVNAESTR